VEIKIKWIKRKQMRHENTYRDDSLVYFGAKSIFFIEEVRKIGKVFIL
jgi:hypothetical protein